MTKQELLRLVEELPEDAPFDELATEIQKLHFKSKVKKGLAQLDRGEGIPHDQVKEKIARWTQR